ncbi:MAG: hypothetical protein FWG41_03835 [Methanomassiliicoccaceae archaeon]|nr:hypothetical protein [Methanomassiliicoccaceae archaeon]
MLTDRGWRQYLNGNVHVMININDGTKIRVTDDDEFHTVFPESIDLKITNRCSIGCKMCHEESTENGDHANLDAPFFDTLRPYTEIAIGGGSPTSHPHIGELLKSLKNKNILANITLHEKELLTNYDKIQEWIDKDLLRGIGVSVHSPSYERVCDFARRNTNTVLHVIAGMTPLETILSYGDMNMKILILGYKNWGRGAEYYRENQETVGENIKDTESNLDQIFNKFKVVSFDNLALRQLNIREHVDDETWGLFYQGSDATHTMYIDLVKEEFAATSTSADRYKLMDTIDHMFAKVKGTMSHTI